MFRLEAEVAVSCGLAGEVPVLALVVVQLAVLAPRTVLLLTPAGLALAGRGEQGCNSIDI